MYTLLGRKNALFIDTQDNIMFTKADYLMTLYNTQSIWNLTLHDLRPFSYLFINSLCESNLFELTPHLRLEKEGN